MSSNITRVPFRILAVSGYEENFPPEGLIDHTTHSQGWQTERFCIFPQSVILAFNFGKCRIKKIQLLMHEFNIPRKVEFFAGTVDTDKELLDKPNIDFQRLGFIALSDNSHSLYNSRELKSIHVDFEATHLKVSLHKNFINTLNLYNQAGIVAINLLGEVMDTDYFVRNMSERNGLHYGLANNLNKDGLVKGFINQDAIDKRIPFLHDLSFEFHQDAKMIKFISALSDAKIEAVKLENFVIAKALKMVLNNAKRASTKIVKLQMQKEKCIQDEDYDGAQSFKMEIEDIKLSLIEELESYGLRIDQDGVIYSDSVDHKESGLQSAKSNLSSKSSSLVSAISSSTASISKSANTIAPLALRVQSPRGKLDRDKPIPIRAKSPQDAESSYAKQEVDKVNMLHLPPQKNTVVTRSGSPLLPAQQKLLEEGQQDTNIAAQLEKPKSPPDSKAKSVITRTGSPMLPAQQKLLESGIKEVERPSSSAKPIITRTGSPLLPAQQKLLSKQGKTPEEPSKALGDTTNGQMPVTKNASNDASDAEPLSASQLEQFSGCIEIFQLFVVQNTLSINFKCREYGLAEISNRIIEWKKKSKNSDLSLSTLSKATLQLAGYCLEDSREKSSLLILGVLNQLLEAVSQYGGNDFQIFNSFTNQMNALIVKGGNTNPRIKSNAVDILKKLLKLYHEQPNSLLPELLKPFKDRKKGAIVHPKIIKSRLEILSFAISEYGISEQDHRFSAASIMSFVQPLIDNTNNDVRDLAFTIAARICINEGESYTSEYTNSMRDAQKEILSKKIASLGGTRKSSIKSGTSKDKHDSKSKDASQNSKVKKELQVKNSSKNQEEVSKNTDEVKPKNKPKTKKATFSDEVIGEKPEKESKKTSKTSKPESPVETCLFCEKAIAPESLENHYAEECPYLVECPQCGLLVEIILLQTHMYGNCEEAPSDPKSCNRCHALISSVDYMSHRSKKKCKVWNIDHDPSICGLCKKSIMGKSGWKVHVLTDKKCISKRNAKPKK